jgi:hypothetical protein
MSIWANFEHDSKADENDGKIAQIYTCKFATPVHHTLLSSTMAQVHNRKDSTESAESVSSTFPTAFKAYEKYKNLKGDIERLQGTVKEQDLGRYISKSEHLISLLSNSDENEVKFSGSKLELDRVMKGMLEHAMGIDSKIYVLAAILSCESKEEGETDLVSNLKAVAETWAYYCHVTSNGSRPQTGQRTCRR